MILLLRCDSITSDGDSILNSLARWQDDGKWFKIPKEGLTISIRYHQKYEVNSLILAEVDNKNGYEIKEDFVPEVFYELLEEKQLDKKNPLEKIILQNKNNWKGKKVYFLIGDIFIGPYRVERERNEWVAYAELYNEKHLNKYNFDDVINSKYFFEDGEMGYFLPQEIEPITVFDHNLFHQILDILSNSSSSNLSAACVQEIRAYVEQNEDASSLLKKHFHDNVDEAISEFSDTLENIESNQELLEKTVQILKEHPSIKNEIEKYKQDEIRQEIDVEIEISKEKLKKEKQELRQRLEEEKREFKKISEKEIGQIEKKVKDKREMLKDLREFYDKKRKELSEYIKKGEKWRNALYPSSDQKFYPDENEVLILTEWDDAYARIHSYSFFEKNLRRKNNVTDDNIIRINKMINQLSQKNVYHINGIEDLVKIESFFEAIGHKKGRFILNADNSWLTPESLWKTKGYLSEHNKLITLPYLFKIAEKNEKFVFQVEILGADRAPIEGYFGPLLKAMERKESVVAQDVLINIPDNVFFFLQLDQDEYTAKPSEWLKNRLGSIQLPSVQHMPKNIAIPYNVLLRKDE